MSVEHGPPIIAREARRYRLSWATFGEPARRRNRIEAQGDDLRKRLNAQDRVRRQRSAASVGLPGGVGLTSGLLSATAAFFCEERRGEEADAR